MSFDCETNILYKPAAAKRLSFIKNRVTIITRMNTIALAINKLDQKLHFTFAKSTSTIALNIKAGNEKVPIKIVSPFPCTDVINFIFPER